MPLYEYECLKCGERFEIIQKFSDEPVKLHAENGGASCGGSVRKLLAAPAIRFKGSGWYVNDYGKGAKKQPKEREEATSKKDTKSSDSSTKSAKPAAKGDGAKSGNGTATAS